MKTRAKITILGLITMLSCLFIKAEFTPLKTYDIDGIKYILIDSLYINNSLSRYIGSAFVHPNNDLTKIYSGKVTIPSEVTINGQTYPVWGYEKLSDSPENETEDLEIVLPDGIKIFTGSTWRLRSKIKSINIPADLERIEQWFYPGLDSIYLHKDIRLCKESGFHAKHVILEDGFVGFEYCSFFCDNDTLVLPGSVFCMPYSMGDENLKCLHITKSKTGKSPIFKNHFFRDCFKIESVICEYEVPPTAETNAFMNKDDNEELGITGRATLYVPAEAIEAYRAHPEWGKFKEILPITNGVTDVTADGAAEVIATEYYDLSGRRLQAPAESGITIVATRYSDGSRRTAKLAK